MRQANRTWFILASIFSAMAIHLSAAAAPVSIVDTTAGTATRDGTVNVGEYAGSSMGINQGFGDVIGGTSQLHIDSDAAGNLNLGIVSLGAALNDFVVIYIDSVSGGATSTAAFIDSDDLHRGAASGTNGLVDSTITFAPGFDADFAVVLGVVADIASATLFELVPYGSHTFLKSVPLSSSGILQFELDAITMSDLAVAPGGSFDYVATLIVASTVFRSDEFQGVAPGTVVGGNIGASPITLNVGDFNRFTSYGAAAAVPGTGPAATVLLVIGIAGSGIGWAWQRARA